MTSDDEIRRLKEISDVIEANLTELWSQLEYLREDVAKLQDAIAAMGSEDHDD